MKIQIANRKWGMITSAPLFAIACAAILVAGTTVSAAPYISTDFQSDTAGEAPGGTAYRNAMVMVVDASTTPVDPFGGQGNQSLLLEDNDGGTPSVTWKGAAGGLPAGDFSDDFYLVSTTEYPTAYATVRFGYTIDRNHWDWGIVINLTGGAIKMTNGANTLTLDNTFSLNEKHTLTIHFNADQTYSGTLDDIDLAKGDTKTFDFNPSLTSNIDTVGLVAGYSSATGVRVFHDNLILNAVPEPASLGILMLSAVGLLRRRGRRRGNAIIEG